MWIPYLLYFFIFSREEEAFLLMSDQFAVYIYMAPARWLIHGSEFHSISWTLTFQSFLRARPPFQFVRNVFSAIYIRRKLSLRTSYGCFFCSSLRYIYISHRQREFTRSEAYRVFNKRNCDVVCPDNLKCNLSCMWNYFMDVSTFVPLLRALSIARLRNTVNSRNCFTHFVISKVCSKSNLEATKYFIAVSLFTILKYIYIYLLNKFPLRVGELFSLQQISEKTCL